MRRRYRLSVKREAHGAASAYIADELATGDIVQVERAHAAASRCGKATRPVVSAECRHRRDTGARNAPRAGRGRIDAGRLVAARRTQRPRTCVHCRGARAAGCAGSPSQPHLLQRARSGRIVPAADFDSAGHLDPAPASAARRAARQLTSISAVRQLSWSDLTAGLAAIGVASGSHLHRIVRRQAIADTRHRGCASQTAAHAPAGAPGPGPHGLVRAQRSQCLLGTIICQACSNWPKLVTCRCAGRAGPGSATTARAGLVAGAVSYRPDPIDAPADGNRADLLLTARRRHRDRSLIGGDANASNNGGI